MSSPLRKELNKRYNLLLKAQKTPRGSLEWFAYKKQRNYCTKLLRSAEISYWNNKLSNAKSSGEFWSLVRSFQGVNKCSTIGPVKSQSGLLLTDNFSKANEFNSYFTNICSTLPNTNSLSPRDISTQPANRICRITPTLQSFTANRELLSYCFKHHIKVGKACGPDKISGKEVQMLGDAFIDNFLNIAKKSFDDCNFPSQWKTAQVHCIHKKGNTQDCGNYRPISLLNIPSKLLESIACFQLDSFLNQGGSNQLPFPDF